MNVQAVPAESQMLTTSEAAKYAGVSRKSIYRAVEDGRLKAAQLLRGHRLLIRRQWLDEWIEDSVVEPRVLPVYDGRAERHQPRRGFLEA